MQINPDIFKAYDVRGLYPGEINEEVARLIGRGFAAYLQNDRVAVSRDMRVSSPGIAAAFTDGVLHAGHRCRRLRHARAPTCCTSPSHTTTSAAVRRSRRRTTRRMYNGVKMVRAGALPLSGDAGIGDIRSMIANDALPRPGTVAARSPRAISSPNTSRK